MTKINIVNNELDDSTGQSKFLGSNNPVSTGDCDFSIATSLKIPNSDTPSVSSVGKIAIDNLVASYPGILKFNDGSSEVSCIPISLSDLSAVTDGQSLGYIAASSKIAGKSLTGVMSAESIRQVLRFEPLADAVQASNGNITVVSGGITPKATDSTIDIICYGQYLIEESSLSNFKRQGVFFIQRTAPVFQTLSSALDGPDIRLSSSDPLPNSRPVTIKFSEAIADVSPRQYSFIFTVPTPGNSGVFYGVSFTSHMIIIERQT